MILRLALLVPDPARAAGFWPDSSMLRYGFGIMGLEFRGGIAGKGVNTFRNAKQEDPHSALPETVASPATSNSVVTFAALETHEHPRFGR